MRETLHLLFRSYFVSLVCCFFSMQMNANEVPRAPEKKQLPIEPIAPELG